MRCLNCHRASLFVMRAWLMPFIILSWLSSVCFLCLLMKNNPEYATFNPIYEAFLCYFLCILRDFFCEKHWHILQLRPPVCPDFVAVSQYDPTYRELHMQHMLNWIVSTLELDSDELNYYLTEWEVLIRGPNFHIVYDLLCVICSHSCGPLVRYPSE